MGPASLLLFYRIWNFLSSLIGLTFTHIISWNVEKIHFNMLKYRNNTFWKLPNIFVKEFLQSSNLTTLNIMKQKNIQWTVVSLKFFSWPWSFFLLKKIYTSFQWWILTLGKPVLIASQIWTEEVLTDLFDVMLC